MHERILTVSLVGVAFSPGMLILGTGRLNVMSMLYATYKA